MIKIYSEKDIAGIEASGKILARILNQLKKSAKIGVSLKELDNLAFRLTKEANAKPAFFGYQPDGAERPYMAAICTSLNETIVHGFPNEYKLKSGDVLKIDFGVEYKKYFSDSAVTVIIGQRTKESERVVKAVKEALSLAIATAKPGRMLGDIGYIIQKTAKKYKCAVIEGLTGHGIGRELHEDPAVYNFGVPKTGIEIKTGMVLAIEPMFSTKNGSIIQKSDESWALRDGGISAQFEHTIAITKKGAKILTK